MARMPADAIPGKSLGRFRAPVAHLEHAPIRNGVGVDGLIEKAPQVISGDLAQRRHEIAPGGVLKCVPLKIGTKAACHSIRPDQPLRRAEHQCGLAVGRQEVHPAVSVVPGIARDLQRHRSDSQGQTLRAPLRIGADLRDQPVFDDVAHAQDLGVAVRALVEPRLLELVGGQHPLKVLVAELVDRHHLDVRRPGEGRKLVEPVGTGGDERRVLHAAGLLGPARRRHDRQLRIGEGAVVETEPGHRQARRPHHPRHQTMLHHGHQQPDAHRRQLEFGGAQTEPRPGLRQPRRRDVAPGFEVRFHNLHEVRRRGAPGEVVDPFGAVDHGPAPAVDGGVSHLDSGRAENPVLGDRHCHAVGTEIREELGGGVKLVAVPAPSPSNTATLGNHWPTR